MPVNDFSLINDSFLIASNEYFKVVQEFCKRLMNSIYTDKGVPLSSKYDLCEYLNRTRERKFYIEIYTYMFHGNGCTVFQDNEAIIDWDFGFGSWWCGIEPFKMARTLEHLGTINGRFTKDIIESKCEKYVEKKIFIKRHNQYYPDLIRIDSKQISLPQDYDKLIIGYKGTEVVFDKCDEIDRFIRKSTRIYKKISSLDNYLLSFYKDNRVVCQVPYNDIAYPANAVKIMSDQIIRTPLLSKDMKEYRNMHPNMEYGEVQH